MIEGLSHMTFIVRELDLVRRMRAEYDAREHPTKVDEKREAAE